MLGGILPYKAAKSWWSHHWIYGTCDSASSPQVFHTSSREELMFFCKIEKRLELKGGVSGQILHEGPNIRASLHSFEPGGAGRVYLSGMML